MKKIQETTNMFSGKEYRIKGKNGWTLVTNDFKIAKAASESNREFGNNRVTRFSINK